MSNAVKTERRGHVLEVTLDRPKANAIDLETSRVLGHVFKDFRDDPEIRVAIITGAGEMVTRWMAITAWAALVACRS
jgi:crotonobetainyl-CoA hydratase